MAASKAARDVCATKKEHPHAKEEEPFLEWAAKEACKWIKRALKAVNNRFKLVDPENKYEGKIVCKAAGYTLALAAAVAPESWVLRITLLGSGATTTRAC